MLLDSIKTSDPVALLPIKILLRLLNSLLLDSLPLLNSLLLLLLLLLDSPLLLTRLSSTW